MKWPGEDSKRERGETFGPLRGPKDGLYSGFGLVCAIFFTCLQKLNTVVQDITPHECIFYPLTKFKFKFRHFLCCSATVFLFGHAVDCTDAVPTQMYVREKRRIIVHTERMRAKTCPWRSRKKGKLLWRWDFKLVCPRLYDVVYVEPLHWD